MTMLLCKIQFTPSTSFEIDSAHLTFSSLGTMSLIQNIDKGIHGLTQHDLDKEDKMNFDASKKTCSARVTG
ncbi:Vacuolar proton translocating ATPase 100 kDa subunit [Frankliniella fusca]|uniref:Vacuolar proton translocating ATPase 100 kDa subunit n=1 Tax=Frankliniella fusca TaxID=407009 RepID=A0AAE1LJC9_9NEOP|nr:Vacuolar proton translocating ATPase 100 kDa subunit [Frankliniella fusca]